MKVTITITDTAGDNADVKLVFDARTVETPAFILADAALGAIRGVSASSEVTAIDEDE